MNNSVYYKSFQLTRSRGAWPFYFGTQFSKNGNFNSHAHVERDWDLTVNTVRTLDISTHTLTWSVTPKRERGSISERFQLTRSRGAWPACRAPRNRSGAFQLTRSRGAWLDHIKSYIRDDLFQLTRSRGAWLQKWRKIATYTWFQLTRSRGAWHLSFPYSILFHQISTHTLTWSVTLWQE